MTETFDVFYEATPWLGCAIEGGLAVDFIHCGEDLESSLNSTEITADFLATDELFGQVDDWQLAAIYS